MVRARSEHGSAARNTCRAAAAAKPARGPPSCRFSDFKVNEVALDGRVVRLTSLQAPKVRRRCRRLPLPPAACSSPLAASRPAFSTASPPLRTHPQAAGPTAEQEAAAAATAADPAEAVEAAVRQYAAIVGVGEGDEQLAPLRAFLQQALLHQADTQERQALRQARRQDGAAAAAAQAAAEAAGAAAAAAAAQAPAPESAAAAPTPTAPLPPAAQQPEPLLLPPMADKEQRTAVHRLFKLLPGFPRLGTDTVNPPAQQDVQHSAAAGQQRQASSAKPQCIRVTLAGGRSGGGRGGGRDGGRGRGQKRKWRDDSGWAGGAQRYTIFLLYKENMDSQVGGAGVSGLMGEHA